MAVTKRIYLVYGKDTEVLVNAASQASAIGFVVRGQYKARPSTTFDVARLVSAGVKVLEAGDVASD